MLYKNSRFIVTLTLNSINSDYSHLFRLKKKERKSTGKPVSTFLHENLTAYESHTYFIEQPWCSVLPNYLLHGDLSLHDASTESTNAGLKPVLVLWEWTREVNIRNLKAQSLLLYILNVHRTNHLSKSSWNIFHQEEGNIHELQFNASINFCNVDDKNMHRV